MRRLFLLLMVTTAMFFQACGEHDDDEQNSGAVFESYKTFSFTAEIDPSTLMEVQAHSLPYDSREFRDNTYVISNQEELSAFNETFRIQELEPYFIPQYSFDDLDVYTYFMMRGPTCSRYYEYSGYQYNAPSLTIIMAHFRQSDAMCPQDFSDFYYILKAKKS